MTNLEKEVRAFLAPEICGPNEYWRARLEAALSSAQPQDMSEFPAEEFIEWYGDEFRSPAEVAKWAWSLAMEKKVGK